MTESMKLFDNTIDSKLNLKQIVVIMQKKFQERKFQGLLQSLTIRETLIHAVQLHLLSIDLDVLLENIER